MDSPKKFIAAVLEQNNKPLVLQEVTFPGPLKCGQVLVKLAYSGICGKQIEEIQGSAGPDKFLPHMLGHEGSGEVVAIGPGVTKVKPKQKVVLHWLKGSGIDAETPYYERNGSRINAGWITTFNQFAVLSENRVTAIPDDADLLSACVIGCAGMTGVGVVLYEANVRAGETVAVVGCGGVGLCSIQGAKAAGASEIIAIDLNPSNLDQAHSLGATTLINPDKEDVVAVVRRLTNAVGARATIVTVGSAKAIEMAAQITSMPGQLFLVAVPPFGTKISIDALSVHRQLSLTGSFGGGAQPDRDVNRLLKLDRAGILNLKSVVGQVLKFEQINQGIDLLRNGATGRMVLDFS